MNFDSMIRNVNAHEEAMVEEHGAERYAAAKGVKLTPDNYVGKRLPVCAYLYFSIIGYFLN